MFLFGINKLKRVYMEVQMIKSVHDGKATAKTDYEVKTCKWIIDMTGTLQKHGKQVILISELISATIREWP